MNASPGLIHMVQEALQHPMSHMPMESLENASGMAGANIREVACWIMGFEHAMRMVESYINAGLPNYIQQGEVADRVAKILNKRLP